jgi:hypothetical protein
LKIIGFGFIIYLVSLSYSKKPPSSGGFFVPEIQATFTDSGDGLTVRWVVFASSLELSARLFLQNALHGVRKPACCATLGNPATAHAKGVSDAAASPVIIQRLFICHRGFLQLRAASLGTLTEEGKHALRTDLLSFVKFLQNIT